MRTRPQFALAGLALFGAPVAASACEPIVPFIKAVGGPGVLTGAFAVFGAAVLLKAATFARFQKTLSLSQALRWMLAATVVTSVIGVVTAAMIGRGGALLLGVPLVWGICLFPAQRLIAAAPLRFARFTPRALAFGMTAGLVLSYVLFGISSMVQDSANAALFWIVKILAVYVGLTIGIALAACWEEWILWCFSRSPENDVRFVQPVIRSNLIVLVGVMLISAAVIIPSRLKNPGFIVSEKPRVTLEHIKRSI
jgi:hypothetical protein